MSIETFYARSRWGSRWGVVDQAHPTPHKGLDIIGTSRKAVPILRTGTIVADRPSASVGRYITVQVSATEFDTYCHVVSRGVTGRVLKGSTPMLLAGWDDPHGSAWTGPHLHYARSSTLTGWAFWGSTNKNPETVVIAALTTTAGGGTTPLPTTKETDMDAYLLYNAPTATHSAARRAWWVPGERLDALTDPQALLAGSLLKQMRRLASTTEQSVVTTNVSDSQWAFIEWSEGLGDMPVDIDEAALAAELAELLGPQLQPDIDEVALAAALEAMLDDFSVSAEDRAAIAAAAGEAARLALAAALSNG